MRVQQHRFLCITNPVYSIVCQDATNLCYQDMNKPFSLHLYCVTTSTWKTHLSAGSIGTHNSEPAGRSSIGYTRDFCFYYGPDIIHHIPIQNQWRRPQNYPECQPSGAAILNARNQYWCRKILQKRFQKIKKKKFSPPPQTICNTRNWNFTCISQRKPGSH